jgi:hypothetical protein
VVGGLADDVEAEIDLLKRPMEWNGNTTQPRISKQEADEADHGLAIPRVESGPLWNERLKQAAGTGVVQENKRLPASGQERAGHEEPRR